MAEVLVAIALYCQVHPGYLQSQSQAFDLQRRCVNAMNKCVVDETPRGYDQTELGYVRAYQRCLTK